MRRPLPGIRKALTQRFTPPKHRSKLDAKRARAGGRTRARPGAPSSNGHIGRAELEERRAELSRQFVALQWDLGGVAYEMASRDHFRLDVLVHRAALLQQVDSELGQLERIIRMEESGAAGTCPKCGALQAHGAVFCWQCGKELKPPVRPGEGGD